VHDVVFVTVVNAREHLFHQNGGVTLCELASCDDFVEEFTSFADSKTVSQKRLLSDDVVSLLIFEVLVHFDDVGVVL